MSYIAYVVGCCTWGWEVGHQFHGSIALVLAGWSLLTLLWQIAVRPA